METQNTIDQLPNGIYFNLGEDVYHAQKRLSSSGIQNMLVSPATFWEKSWLNNDKEEAEQKAENTFARLLGSAYHCARLEPELFGVKYCEELSPDVFPKCLSKDVEYKAELKLLGEAQTKAGETVLDRAKRLQSLTHKICYHIEYDKWRETLCDKQPLKPRYWRQIHRDIERMKDMPEITEKMRGGYAEVSVFWTCPDSGISMKARIDYLRHDGMTDFKTFVNSMGKPLERCVRDAFQYNRYYLQATIYWQACELIRKGLINIEGEYKPEHETFVKCIQARPIPHTVHYVFQEKGGVPNLLCKEIMIYYDKLRVEGDGVYFGDQVIQSDANWEEVRHSRFVLRALIEIERGKRDFLKYSASYEEGVPWHPLNPMGSISDADFSDFFLEGK